MVLAGAFTAIIVFVMLFAMTVLPVANLLYFSNVSQWRITTGHVLASELNESSHEFQYTYCIDKQTYIIRANRKRATDHVTT